MMKYLECICAVNQKIMKCVSGCPCPPGQVNNLTHCCKIQRLSQFVMLMEKHLCTKHTEKSNADTVSDLLHYLKILTLTPTVPQKQETWWEFSKDILMTLVTLITS